MIINCARLLVFFFNPICPFLICISANLCVHLPKSKKCVYVGVEFPTISVRLLGYLPSVPTQQHGYSAFYNYTCWKSVSAALYLATRSESRLRNYLLICYKISGAAYAFMIFFKGLLGCHILFPHIREYLSSFRSRDTHLQTSPCTEIKGVNNIHQYCTSIRYSQWESRDYMLFIGASMYKRDVTSLTSFSAW